MKNNKYRQEVDVPSILGYDGVINNDFEHENLPISSVSDIIAQQDSEVSWSYRLVNTENNSATLISQLPGEGNRMHHHPDWNEWWYILKGSWKWEIEGEEFTIKQGDFVFIQKGKWHKITATGNESAIRLAVSRADVPHVYNDSEDDL